MVTKIVDTIHKIQNGDEKERERLLNKYKKYIQYIGSKVCGRNIDIHDDEMSICIIAFNQALDNFKHEVNVSFKSYAAVVIRNKLIDFLRKENRHKHLSLELKNDNSEEDIYSPFEIQEAFKIHQIQSDQEMRKYEVIQLGEIFKEFNISWNDLLKDSPKHSRKRRLCLQASNILTSNNDLWEYFWRNKMLPIKKLSEELNVSKRTIESSRKFIAATAIIINHKDNFNLLYEYIKDELKSLRYQMCSRKVQCF